MKQIALITYIFSILNFVALGQRSLPTEEHFDYPIGNLTPNGIDWLRLISPPSGGYYSQVVSGNLTYPNYPMESVGNRFLISPLVPPNDSMVINTLNFIPINTSGSKVYVSFILQLSSQIDLTPAGSHYFGLANDSLKRYENAYAGVWLKHDTLTNGFQIGLSKNSGGNSVVWSANSYNYGPDNILIVLNYEFVEGITNDTVRLWINPDLSGNEPEPTLVATSENLDAPSISNFFIRLYEIPSGYLDEIKIANDWSQSPLPVELTQFSASANESYIILNWKTETEVNNYGFNILRTEGGGLKSEWENIGFVKGHGNNNTPSFYTFLDNNVVAKRYSYKLKQIDNDGKIEYSKIIEVDNFAPDQFKLYQNYPNPFNPETKINFLLPKATNVKIKIFNIIGQEIMTLLDEFFEPGIHSVTFNGGNFSGGLYIYKIEADNFIQARKMILMK